MSKSVIEYIRPLDALRGFAVLLVVIHHWIPGPFTNVIPIGSIGVDIFFVLSGYLITRILLEQKANASKKGKSIVNFYIRRSLRIFPLYYVVLVCLVLFKNWLPNSIPAYWPYFFFYLQNFLFIDLNSFTGGKVGHFWSLAVEEQFYLVWPWIILFVSEKYFHLLFKFGIVLGVVCSFIFPNVIFSGNGLISAHPLTCVQSFCIGGYLSYLCKYSLLINNKINFLKYFAFLCLGLYLINMIFFPNVIGFGRTLISFFTGWIIYVLTMNKYYGFNWLFNNSFLVFMGKISYGIYIIHNFVPVSVKSIFHFFQKIFPKNPLFIINREDQSILFFLICFIVLICASLFSYNWIEKPFLRLKKFFV